MGSLKNIADTLRGQAKAIRVTQADLRARAGVSTQTLTNVLSGSQDYKVTTLFAIADRLGFDVVLIPKAAAQAGLHTVVGAQSEPKAMMAEPPRAASAVSKARDDLRARIRLANRSAE